MPIPRVIKFATKLHFKLFRKLYGFLWTEILIVIAEPQNVRNARTLSEIEVEAAGGLKAAGVKDRSHAWIEAALAPGKRIGAWQGCWNAPSSELGRHIAVAGVKAEGRPGLKRKNGADLPAAENTIENASTIHKPLTFSNWETIN